MMGCQIYITDGIHSLRSDDHTAKFMAIIYGTDDRESYGFPVRTNVVTANQGTV